MWTITRPLLCALVGAAFPGLSKVEGRRPGCRWTARQSWREPSLSVYCRNSNKSSAVRKLSEHDPRPKRNARRRDWARAAAAQLAVRRGKTSIHAARSAGARGSFLSLFLCHSAIVWEAFTVYGRCTPSRRSWKRRPWMRGRAGTSRPISECGRAQLDRPAADHPSRAAV